MTENPPSALNATNLTLPKEGTYFVFALVFSILVWLGLAATLIWIPILLLFALFTWLGHGLLIAQLQADAVKVDAAQHSALHNTFRDVCTRLGLQEKPELYILQSGGMLNAFATRHCGRNFVVVFADLLESYGPESAEIRFLLGHEIGHIQRSHLSKHIFLAPGLFCPLLGAAYSRACESSCDRFGAYAAGDLDAAARAMTVLSGGKDATKWADPAQFAVQHTRDRGFFVSWYELVTGYPTLSQRVHQLLDLKARPFPERAPRHPLAYFFAFFTFGGAGKGGANVMITVAVIGLLAAIAIPNFIQARNKARLNACTLNQRIIEDAKTAWATSNGKTAGATVTWQDLYKPGDLNNSYLRTSPVCRDGGAYQLGRIGESPVCGSPRHNAP